MAKMWVVNVGFDGYQGMYPFVFSSLEEAKKFITDFDQQSDDFYSDPIGVIVDSIAVKYEKDGNS